MWYNINMYTIGQFANLIGKTVQTLRDWDKKDILKTEYRTQGGHRMYGFVLTRR